MTKKNSYTTQDIKNSVQEMEDEKLPLTAPVEVSIEGDDDIYEISRIGHFHAVPNMTINLKLKNYTKKNGSAAITLRGFLSLINFREIVSEKQNTSIVRIYTDFPSGWIEFGVNEWNYDKDDLIDEIINKKVLDRTVSSVNYDDVLEVLCINLREVEGK